MALTNYVKDCHLAVRSNYRTAFNVGRLLVRVATPRHIADDLLRNLMVKL